MKLFFYCQHVLGIGHLFRALEICRALSGHSVLLVSGGQPIQTELPPNVRLAQLPALMMDAHFQGLYSPDGQNLETVKNARKRQLHHLFATEKPDVLLIELYPFGRKAFAFELDPLLQAIHDGTLLRCPVVCSLRDILVEKSDTPKYETRVITRLNDSFDHLLIHADPHLITLEETFSRVADIQTTIGYTGYITPQPAPHARQRIRCELNIGPEDKLIVVSAGSGSVGQRLLQAARAAFDYLADHCHLQILTGPYMSKQTMDDLRDAPHPRIRVLPFVANFPSLLAAADLSLSMGGYNTTMNLLAAGTPALVWPFAQNREQGLRAARLAARHALTVLSDTDVQAPRLAAIIHRKLAQPRGRAPEIDLNGASQTAQQLCAIGRRRSMR